MVENKSSPMKRHLTALAVILSIIISTISAFAVPPGAQPTKIPAKDGNAVSPAATTTEAKPAADANAAPAALAPESVGNVNETEAAVETSTAASAGPYSSDEVISENQPEQGAVPLKDLSLGEPVTESGKENPFFTDSTLKLGLRSYYFNRNPYSNDNSEAWALGGSLAFKSGYLFDRLGMGAVLYTSQPLYAPDSRDGTGLLQEDQEGYTALGQIYGEVKIVDGLQLNFGRKEYNTPFINMHDVRMTPKTFQGMTLTGAHKGAKEGSNWRYGAGYIYKMKDWTEQDFDWTSDALGVDENRGIFTGGGNYSTDKLSIGAIEYYSPDVLNIFYTEGSYGWKLSPKTSIKLGLQFTDQRSTGDDLITGDDFDVQQWGVKTDFGLGDATVTLGFTDATAGGTDMRSPWGGYPGYTSVQVKDFNRSNESATLIKVAYDFTNLGAAGLSAYLLWVHGFNRDVDGTFNEDEWDANVQWAPKEGPMKNFSARFRYAMIRQRGDGDPVIDDFRLIFNYSFSLYPFGFR